MRNIPVMGICETCQAEFTGDPLSGNSQSVIQKQFNLHQCRKAAEPVAAEPVAAETGKKAVKKGK